MRRFFDRPDTRWRSLSNCLHVYAVPSADSELRPAFAAMAAGLVDVPGLGHQPVEHVHMTVQRLDAFSGDIPIRVLTGLIDGLAGAARSVAPFPLAFRAPEVTSHAIQAIAPAPESWVSLTAAVRAAVSGAGLSEALTPPPPAPHFTLAYGTAQRDDSELVPLLERVGRPTSALVDTVSLVAVDQDPVEGAFRFSVLQELPLGR